MSAVAQVHFKAMCSFYPTTVSAKKVKCTGLASSSVVNGCDKNQERLQYSTIGYALHCHIHSFIVDRAPQVMLRNLLNLEGDLYPPSPMGGSVWRCLWLEVAVHIRSLLQASRTTCHCVSPLVGRRPPLLYHCTARCGWPNCRLHCSYVLFCSLCS